MKIRVCPNNDGLGKFAAEVVVNAIARGREDFVLGLATGSSPEPLYEELAVAHRAGRDFSRLQAFALDEYVGLDYGHPESYHAVLNRFVTEPLELRAEAVHAPDGMAEDLVACAAEYDHAIAAAGGIDLQILGVGRNGHIGFNEPGSAQDSRTRLVDLQGPTIEDNKRFFTNPGEHVPTQAVTQGIGTILEARELLLIANGPAKARAIYELLLGSVTDQVPVTFLREHPALTVVIDEAAAALLPPDLLAEIREQQNQ